jgi:hypothetical protein
MRCISSPYECGWYQVDAQCGCKSSHSVMCDNLANPCHGHRFVWGCNLPTRACACINPSSQPVQVHKPVTIPRQGRGAIEQHVESMCSQPNLQLLLSNHSLSGFHQVALRSGPNGLWLQGLKEYSDSYPAPDYLGPVLGSKCLVMQTLGNYLRLGPSEETSESMFQVATRTFNLLYYFPFMLLIGLTSLTSIYSRTPVLF